MVGRLGLEGQRLAEGRRSWHGEGGVVRVKWKSGSCCALKDWDCYLEGTAQPLQGLLEVTAFKGFAPL